MKRTADPLIFIIQDSLIYKDLIVGYLQQKKYKNLQTFKSGEDCLKEIHQKPDIIILDYSFEGINGLDFMKRVRIDHPEIDFIFLSGQNSVEIAVSIMKIGAADYIVKNAEAPQNLVKSIEHLLSVQKSEKIKKGYQIGVVGFFLMLFLIILIIVLVALLVGDSGMI